MPYYKICDRCGANLDPGEKCTCVEDARREAIAKDIEKKAQATMQLVLGKRGVNRGRNVNRNPREKRAIQ